MTSDGRSRLQRIRDRYTGSRSNCAADVTDDVVWLLDALGKACNAADGRDKLVRAYGERRRTPAADPL